MSSPASAHKRSLSHSEEYVGAADKMSLHSVPILYTNMVPEGEDIVSNPSQVKMSWKISLKRSPSKLSKHRGTKGKQTENLANGSIRGDRSKPRRSGSRTSQCSVRSDQGPVFEMVTTLSHATITDAGGAFGIGAIMAAPKGKIKDKL